MAKRPKVLIFGPENSGKTTLLYQLKYSEFIQTIPTFGSNCETIFFNNQPMVFWDVGSSAPVQQFFNSYLKGTNALVFVIDSSDKERIGNARLMMLQVMEEMQSVPLIIVGNKIDEDGAMGRDEIVENLGLNNRVEWKWHIVMTSALKNKNTDDVLKCIHMCLYSRR